MPKAQNPTEGGSTALESYDWAYTGTRPDNPEDAGYVALGEPTAEYDNNWNYIIREDLKQLNYEAGENAADIDSLDSRLTTAESEISTLQSDFGSHVHDSRYYTKTQSDDQFVNVSGDSVTGPLYATDRLSVNSTSSIGQFHIGPTEGTDTRTAVIDSDGDAGQNDDALLVRGNPDITAITDADAALAVKGDGRVGVNRYSPRSTLDVGGDAEFDGGMTVRGTLDVANNYITGVNDTIEFTSANGSGLDFRPGSDGSHFLWRHDDGAATPTEFSAQLSPATGTVWQLRNEAGPQSLISVETDGTIRTHGGELDASDADWVTLPTYSGSDPNPPNDGNLHMWGRANLN